MTQIKTTVLPAGPTKRVWVNKHHLPQFGGRNPLASIWEVECDGKRYRGYGVNIHNKAWCMFLPDDGDGPHAYVETVAEIVIYTAAEEAA